MPRWRRDASLAQRPAAEWIVRGGLALVLAGLGYISVTRAIGDMMSRRDVARAHAIAPGDGHITAMLAQFLSGPEASASERLKADDLARAALQQEPAAVAAVAALGLNAQVRGSSEEATRLFGYAERLSRRDLTTQIWAIEAGAAQGDVAGVLRHYDIALRTSREAPNLLFPVLAAAISEAPVRAALVATLAARPAWSESFVGYIARNGPDPQANAALLLDLGRRGGIVTPQNDAALVDMLVASNLAHDGWAYYAARHPGVDRRIARDPRFVLTDVDARSRFDWQIPDLASGYVFLQPDGRVGFVDLAVPATWGGTLLEQMQVLPPGEYRLNGHSAGIDQDAEARPFWRLACSDGRELARIIVPNSAEAGGSFAGRLRVPQGCATQMLSLVARPSAKIGGVVGRFDRLHLVPDA